MDTHNQVVLVFMAVILVIGMLLFIWVVWRGIHYVEDLYDRQEEAQERNMTRPRHRSDPRRVYPAQRAQARMEMGAQAWSIPVAQLSAGPMEETSESMRDPCEHPLYESMESERVVQDHCAAEPPRKVFAGVYSPEIEELHFEVCMVRRRSAPPILIQSARGSFVEYVPVDARRPRRKSDASHSMHSSGEATRVVAMDPVAEVSGQVGLVAMQDKNSSGESVSAVTPLLPK